MKENKKEIKVKLEPNKKVALRDFHIKHNEHDIEIKKGDVVNVPKMFIPNLITEKVIKE